MQLYCGEYESFTYKVLYDDPEDRLILFAGCIAGFEVFWVCTHGKTLVESCNSNDPIENWTLTEEEHRWVNEVIDKAGGREYILDQLQEFYNELLQDPDYEPEWEFMRVMRKDDIRWAMDHHIEVRNQTCDYLRKEGGTVMLKVNGAS